MEVNVENWPVSKLWKLKDRINEQPEYQRGEVWTDKKKSLLIDSMLRGIDIPKIYLRKLDKGDYEVADGQQRITSILKFKSNDLKLPTHVDKGLDLSKVQGKEVGGYKYEKLPQELRKAFDNYKLTVAIVNNAKGDEIRILFGRLQEGVNLNPPEKRNAIISYVGRHIDNFALNHDFFLKSKITTKRYKRQDYLAHVITLVAYQNKQDLKADLILKLYLDKSFVISEAEMKKISVILDFMHETDIASSFRMYKKFHFIDMFWFLYLNYSKIDQLNPSQIAKIFDQFEERRLDVADPKDLIDSDDATEEDQDLYDYYMAFKYNGSSTESIETRCRVYENLFLTNQRT